MVDSPSSSPAAHRPRVDPAFYRAHGLGNDYLVFEAAVATGPGWSATPSSISRICDRHRGIGSDGIVVLLDARPDDGVFPLRMFNPDGSEFERSGNGLRVLAAFLHRRGHLSGESCVVRSGGSVIPMVVHGVDGNGVYDVSVDMGRARTGATAVGLDPDAMREDDVLAHPELGPVSFVPVSVGNPHAVVFTDRLPGDRLREVSIDEVGPFLGRHEAFAKGTNVQLVGVSGPAEIEIEIWERGVGRTTASGTSSCAAAVAAVSTGRIEPGAITVRMEGGTLGVSVSADLDVVLRGPVAEVAEGRLSEGFLASLG